MTICCWLPKMKSMRGTSTTWSSCETIGTNDLIAGDAIGFSRSGIRRVKGLTCSLGLIWVRTQVQPINQKQKKKKEVQNFIARVRWAQFQSYPFRVSSSQPIRQQYLDHLDFWFFYAISKAKLILSKKGIRFLCFLIQINMKHMDAIIYQFIFGNQYFEMEFYFEQ